MNALQQTITLFLNHCRHERNFSSHTIAAYKLDLQRFCEALPDTIRSGPIEAVSREYITKYLQRLNGLKPRTVRRRMASLKSFFGYLEREEHIAVNPAKALRLDVRRTESLPRIIHLPILRRFFTHLQRSAASKTRTAIRDLAMFELLFATGMRVSEACGLKTDALDLERGCVVVDGKGANSGRSRYAEGRCKRHSSYISRYEAHIPQRCFSSIAAASVYRKLRSDCAFAS